MYQSDTIAAISTALSDSGIGIIRISGNDAVKIADRVFCNPGGKRILTSVPSHTVHYGYIMEEESIVDEVMAVVMLSPKSFTTEDTVEFNCHGGIVVLQKVLKLVLLAGARLAQPGEFTKRAFLNGRIDLSKAEAVMDIIHSQNEYALKSSVNQLTGHLSNKIKELREKIIYEIAFIESALDDPEHISLDGYLEELSNKLIPIKADIKHLIDTAEDGRRIKEGIQTVIVGKPNAGKSSLINLLSGSDKAIVTEIAGTTRDILEETININGITLNMIDTAGIRDTSDKVEQIGVERAKQYAKDADFILFVIDSSIPLDENDLEIFSLIKEKPVMILLNKADLDEKVTVTDIEKLLEQYSVSKQKVLIHRTSMMNQLGLDTLKQDIESLFFEGRLQNNSEIMITNMRHKEALENAYQSIGLVEKSIMDEMPEDFLSIDLMSAYSSLGFIIGEEVDDDLVNTIFSKFCMGK